MDLPALDCHAHVSPSVTNSQLEDLGQAIVFAMTREPTEAVEASRRHDRTLVWGCGAHPAYVAQTEAIDLDQLVRRSKSFAVIGEIGLDRRSGNLEHQHRVFRELLDQLSDEPVLMSVHSAGCTRDLVEVMRAHRPKGVVVHWFTGKTSEADELLSLDAYFSVNTAMRHEILGTLPLERLLPETDFPAARRRTGSKPGDVAALELVLSQIHGSDPAGIRRQFYRNLRRVAVSTGAIDRMPGGVVDLLLTA